MQETKGTATSSGGFLKTVKFPRSHIYVSTQAEHKKKYKFQTKEGAFHFFLIFTPGANYSAEDIKECKGKYACYNCTQAIQGEIFFYPTEYSKLGDFTCSPIPHCRQACVLRTIHDLPNNTNLLGLFVLRYGTNIKVAPPRSLLFVPGGLSIDKYHDTIKDSLVITQEQDDVRSFLAPLFISCTFLQGHKLVDGVIALIHEISLEEKVPMGPSKCRNNIDLTVVELPEQNLAKSNLSRIFAIDPNSYRKSEVPVNSNY